MKLVKNRDDDTKPRVKETETIKFPNQPKAEDYKQWKTQVREEIIEQLRFG